MGIPHFFLNKINCVNWLPDFVFYNKNDIFGVLLSFKSVSFVLLSDV